MKTREIIPILLHLIEDCEKTGMEFEQAARRMDDVGLKALLINLWRERSQWISELEDKIRGAGGSLPDRRPNINWVAGGPGHYLDGTEIRQLLARCGRDDMETRLDYESALAHSLPLDVRLLLQRHSIGLKRSTGRMCELASRIPPGPRRDQILNACHN